MNKLNPLRVELTPSRRLAFLLGAAHGGALLLLMTVPLPFWIKSPEPEMALATVIASERLMANVPLLVMPLAVEIAPRVPPAPIWSVPVLIVIAPV